MVQDSSLSEYLLELLTCQREQPGMLAVNGMNYDASAQQRAGA